MKEPRIAQIPSEHSQNFNKKQGTIKKIIIHSMGEFIDAESDDFHAKEWLDFLGYAAHFLVCPSGIIIQTLPTNIMGAHAKGHNWETIGIEFLVPGMHTYGTFLKRIENPYLTEEQLQAGIHLAAWLKEQHSKAEITSHQILDPDRKYDPGRGFPWEKYLADVDKFLETHKETT